MKLLLEYFKYIFSLKKKRCWNFIKNGENKYWYYIPKESSNEKLELNYCTRCGKGIDHNENCARCTKCKTIN